MRYGVLIFIAAFALAGCAGERRADGPFLGKETIFRSHKSDLNEAGELYRCEEAVKEIRRKLAKDRRLADADLKDELSSLESVKETMPYPSPGAACSVFGYPQALRGAIEDRRGKKK